MNTIKPWTKGAEREIARTRIFRVITRHCASPSDPKRAFDAAILQCPDWVNVIGLTAAGEIVLIEQYRHGSDVVTLEIPGGMVDAGETPIEAAVRELREETGYEGSEAFALGVTRPNPAFQDNRLTTVFVRDCRLVSDAHGDEHEEIAVRLAPLEDVRALVKEGAIDHSLVVAAFAFTALAGDRGVPNLLG